MHVIPLKNKYQLNEQDINDLSRLLAEGSSLAHMAYFFQDRMSAEQIYMAAGIIAKEMYEMPLAELCPHLAQERRELNDEKQPQWNRQNQAKKALQYLNSVLEDLNYNEMSVSLLVKS